MNQAINSRSSSEMASSENLLSTLKILGLSDTEVRARAKVIARFDQMIADRVGTFGKIKSTVNKVGIDAAIGNLQQVRMALLKKDIKPETIIDAWFNGWDALGDTNISVLSPTKTTYRRFIANVMNDSQIVAQIFPSVSPELIYGDIQYIARFERLLLSLEATYPNNEHKNIFRQTHAALQNKDLQGAKEICDTYLKKEWNISIVDAIDTSDKFSTTLRAIGDTNTASLENIENTIKKFENTNNLSENEGRLEQFISISILQKTQDAIPGANNMYTAILGALPKNDPDRIKMEENKEDMISELASQIAYINIIDTYIKSVGSNELGSTLQMYNDMKGLYGAFNFSDENAKLTREGALMLASFVLTAGIGPMLTGIAATARLAQGALIAKNAANAANMTKTASRVDNVVRTTTGAFIKIGSSTSGTIARTTEIGAKINKAVTANKFARIPAEALKFTTADALVRHLTRENGEQSGFHNFANKLAMNTIMFSAFSGMEKFVSAPLLTKLNNNFKIQNKSATFTIGSAIFTAGDIVVMQALHAAEAGKFEWNTHGVIQALAFRIGMQGVSQILPKLTTKYNTQNQVTKGSKIPDNMKALTDRRAELMQWKKDNPGNISHDADLMITETAIGKIEANMHHMSIATTKIPKLANSVIIPKGNEMPEIVENIRLGNERETINIGKPDFDNFSIKKVQNITTNIDKNSSQFIKNSDIIIENAALSKPIKNIIGDKIPGGITGIIDDSKKRGKLSIVDKLKGLDKESLWLLFPILLDSLSLKNPSSNPFPVPPQVTIKNITPTVIADVICQISAGDTPFTDIDDARKNKYKQILTKDYRNDISRRWMKTSTWKNLIQIFKKNQDLLKTTADNKDLITHLNAVLGENGATVKNIQALQRCVGLMGDRKDGQDGILGPITTMTIKKIFNKCIFLKKE